MNFTDYLLISLIEMTRLQIIQMQKAGYGKSDNADKLMEEIYEQVAKKEEYDKNSVSGAVEYKTETQKKTLSERFWKK